MDHTLLYEILVGLGFHAMVLILFFRITSNQIYSTQQLEKWETENAKGSWDENSKDDFKDRYFDLVYLNVDRINWQDNSNNNEKEEKVFNYFFDHINLSAFRKNPNRYLPLINNLSSINIHIPLESSSLLTSTKLRFIEVIKYELWQLKRAKGLFVAFIISSSWFSVGVASIIFNWHVVFIGQIVFPIYCIASSIFVTVTIFDVSKVLRNSEHFLSL